MSCNNLSLQSLRPVEVDFQKSNQFKAIPPYQNFIFAFEQANSPKLWTEIQFIPRLTKCWWKSKILFNKMLSEKQSWLGSGPVFSPIFAVFCMKGYRGQSFLSLVQPSSLYTECTLSMRWSAQMNKMASPNKRAHFYHSWRFMQRISFDSNNWH